MDSHSRRQQRLLTPAEYLWKEPPPYQPPPRCEDCRHFTPDPINPPAGVGTCRVGLGGFHAGALHRCQGFTERKA